MMGGKAVIFSAPSGAGKTTIVRRLLAMEFLHLGFSVSATTRAPRSNEVDGRDYHFLSTEEFQRRIALDELVEWEEVYPGKFYGTLKSELHRMWTAGQTVLFDVDVVGGIRLKKILGDQSLSVFVQPPSLEVLRSRLEHRGTESLERIHERLGKAKWEWDQSVHFDRILINDDLDTACETAASWVQELIIGHQS